MVGAFSAFKDRKVVIKIYPEHEKLLNSQMIHMYVQYLDQIVYIFIYINILSVGSSDGKNLRLA